VFTDREAFARMLDAAITSETVPQALVELATVAPVDELEVLLEVLASRWTGVGRTIGRTVLADGLGERLRQVADLALGMSHAIVSDFLDVAVDRDPEFATACALALVRHQDRPARLKALETLERLPYRGEVGRELTEHALTSTDAEVRGRAASVLAAKGERRAAPAIRRAISSGLESGQGTSELALTVEALARLDPAGALELFRAWLRPGARLSRARATPTPPWNLAIRGLQMIPGKESSELLQWIHSRAEGDLKSRCAQAIAAQKGRDHGD
jgi:hypothetical protein